jgi:hypothetical protein
MEALMPNVIKREKETSSQEGEPDVSPSPATIWEVVDEVMSGVPEEVLKRLPTDGAENHDHYLRGAHAETRRKP